MGEGDSLAPRDEEPLVGSRALETVQAEGRFPGTDVNPSVDEMVIAEDRDRVAQAKIE